MVHLIGLRERRRGDRPLGTGDPSRHDRTICHHKRRMLQNLHPQLRGQDLAYTERELQDQPEHWQRPCRVRHHGIPRGAVSQIRRHITIKRGCQVTDRHPLFYKRGTHSTKRMRKLSYPDKKVAPRQRSRKNNYLTGIFSFEPSGENRVRGKYQLASLLNQLSFNQSLLYSCHI